MASGAAISGPARGIDVIKQTIRSLRRSLSHETTRPDDVWHRKGP